MTRIQAGKKVAEDVLIIADDLLDTANTHLKDARIAYEVGAMSILYFYTCMK